MHMQADAKWLEESYKKVANERYDINCAIKAMPAGLSESFLNFDNVEGMIDKCVEKLKNILDRWRCYLVKEDLKELQDVIDYQVKIKQHIKLGLDSQGSPELEIIDQKELTSSLWHRLGHGHFADVFKAKMKGAQVAVKILKEIQNPSQLNEGRILRSLRHDNIVAYRGMDSLEKDLPDYNLKQGSFMIIMEYVPDNLSTHVENLKSPEVKGLPKSQVWDFGEQIMSGLYYLHSFSIAHRDLKPDNILLEKGARMRLKLADFGLAKLKNSNDEAQHHQRWCAPECLAETILTETMIEVEPFMRSDIFSYGLVLYYMITGDKPWAAEKSHVVSMERTKEGKALPKPPQNLGKGPLNDLYDSCVRLRSKERPTAAEIINKTFQAHTTNPYTVTMQTAEFFTCGFLKDTYIVVADSLVDESLVDSCGPRRPQGYPPDCLTCEVEIGNEEYDDCSHDSEFIEPYLENLRTWKNKAKDKEIDNHANIALKGLTTTREGDDEEQRVVLKFAQATYVHHRAMRDVWKGLDENTKTQILPCKTSVHPMFSTSFGLHVAVITADQMFLFTRRAKRGGIASPGNFTCGAVESCSVKDYDTRTYLNLINTARRGLTEELRVVLEDEDVDAICLTTVYLKYDNHEWGMCGFVDLSDERIAPERRLTYASIQSRFTGASCKDKFEHDLITGVPFKLHEMAHFVRENFHNFASSTKLVVVKVMQSFFGVSEVEKIFKAFDSSS